jgi:hypothetical protein
VRAVPTAIKRFNRIAGRPSLRPANACHNRHRTLRRAPDLPTPTSVSSNARREGPG